VVRRSPSLASIRIGAGRIDWSSVNSRGNERCLMRKMECHVGADSLRIAYLIGIPATGLCALGWGENAIALGLSDHGCA